jgi:hypothetical protein
VLYVNAAKKSDKWPLNIKVAVVRNVAIAVVSTLWSFIVAVLPARTSVYQKKDIREVGSK